MYSVLRTRTAVLEHVWRSFARSGVHWPTNPRVIVTLTLLKVGCNLWGYILSYRHLINRISRCNSRPIQDTIQDPIQGPIAAVDRQDGRFSFGEIHEYVVRGVYPEGFTKENKQALRKRSKFFPFYSDVYITLL